ncbi:hypothetical protein VSU19_15465 [Verrucomicrobiales bacterium BCK34]|nr:hypothetical protein [Verrucomicrobiales bacterium BCK34]
MRKFLQSLAILTLLIWGGLFLFFYLTGRIERHLDPSFRIYALISGIGMILLAAFNFLNRKVDLGDCCHDHAHGDDCEHSKAHDHHHSHEAKTCDHDHSHDHHHGEDCGHDHGAHGHAHEHSKDCDHDGHCHGDHSHDDENHSHEDHIHAHDHEETTSGLAFSLAVLLIPIIMATGISQDKFSSEYLAKWGKIERQMMQMRIAKEREAKASTMKVTETAPNPYTREGIEGNTPGAADTPPNPDEPTIGTDADAAAETEGGENEAWGTFTLEDLKNMVPQSDKGDFLLDVPQIFYTAGDKELMQVMEGIPIETTAQLMEETMSNANGQRLKAFRLFIECCAADARPLSIPVDFGKAPPEYTEMGWYKLFGKLHYAEEDGEIIPLINIDRIEEALEPTDGLLY